MVRIFRIFVAVALWILAVVLAIKGYNPLESALYATIALFVHPSTSRFLIGKARRMAGQATAETDLAVAANVMVLEEEGRKLRVDAGKHRILGQFDAAYRNYKRAYELYVKLGDKDAQCNVLCSLAETTPRREEIRGYVERIEAVCASILDADEKAKALRNLDALKQRLKQSRGWAS
jgi:hypothetical protein